MPPISANRCHPSVPIVVPPNSAIYQCCLSVLINDACQCPSVLISDACQCLLVPPTSASSSVPISQ
ncbi:unnamed protein product, partial [Staurois parvus]